MATTGVMSIMDPHPQVGLLALAALQQQIVEPDRTGRDLASTMSAAMAMIPQGYLLMNQCMYHRAPLTRSWVARAKSSGKLAEAMNKEARESKKRAEDVEARAKHAENINATIVAARVEAIRVRAKAEEDMEELRARNGSLETVGAVTKGKLEALQARVDNKVKAAKADVRTEIKAENQKYFNSFYVEGWMEPAAYMRAWSSHFVWDVANVIVPCLVLLFLR